MSTASEAARTDRLRLVPYNWACGPGVSLRAAGWRDVAQLRPRPGWDTPTRNRASTGHDQRARTRWEAP